MTSPDFNTRLSAAAQATKAALAALLPPQGTKLADAMRYAALSGGKRLRAFLVLETAALHDLPEAGPLRAAVAVECLHAYSLVHDDLPAMDDDDLRRGLPTLHRKWDEATAILAGDALQTIAFELLADPATAEDPARRLALITGLAEAAGAHGMVGGQMLDIAAETSPRPLTLEEITRLQALKTGALITWSATAGAHLAAAPTHALATYAAAIGLAFQIQDDILDVTGSADVTGKATGKDAAAGKATFVSLLGLDAARKKAENLADEACDALAPYGSKAEGLRQAAGFIVHRES